MGGTKGERRIPVCGCAAPEKAEGLPLPLCVKCGRMIVSAPQPVMDPGVSEYEIAWHELGCRVPVEQSLAAMGVVDTATDIDSPIVKRFDLQPMRVVAKTCRCVYGTAAPTPFDRCNHCGLPLA